MAPRPETADARALAWEILQRVEDGAFADALLGRRLNQAALSPRDRALATRLVYGTLAWQGYLDHIIAAFSHRPPADLDPPVRLLLRLALCQICLLTKIPSFAAVNTAVDLAKRHRGGATVGLVNALLRRAAAGWHGVRFPSRAADPIGYLATRLSHPRWLVEQWVEQYGHDETEALLRANNEPAPTVLRVNRGRMNPAELVALLHSAGGDATPAAYSPVGVRVEAAGAPDALPGHADGLFSVQGEASQLVGFMVSPQPGERVLDACAAPGGKTTHLAELMADRGEIVALDPNARGIARLKRMAQRLGLSIIHAAVADATGWEPSGAPFDRVLIDAPCSGLGTLRQHPELKWRRTPQDLGVLADAQQRLLRRVAPWVRPGGILVYATCTLTAVENDDTFAAFLRDHLAFCVEDPRPFLPDSARALVGSDGVLRTFPHRHGLDGFIAVRLKRHGVHGIVAP